MKANQLEVLLAFLATMAFTPPCTAADTMVSCMFKKHPVKNCSYDWDVEKNRCTYTCLTTQDPFSPAQEPPPKPKPGNFGENDRVPSPDAASEVRKAQKTALGTALDGQEQQELKTYRRLFEDAKKNGGVKRSEMEIITNRSELEMYRTILPKELQEKAGRTVAPR